MLIFDILHDPFRSLSQKVGLSYLEVFGCENYVFGGRRLSWLHHLIVLSHQEKGILLNNLQLFILSKAFSGFFFHVSFRKFQKVTSSKPKVAKYVIVKVSGNLKGEKARKALAQTSMTRKVNVNFY